MLLKVNPPSIYTAILYPSPLPPHTFPLLSSTPPPPPHTFPLLSTTPSPLPPHTHSQGSRGTVVTNDWCMMPHLFSICLSKSPQKLVFDCFVLRFIIMLQLNQQYMSRIVRKPDFCLCENKGADQLRGNREADQRLCFRYTDSTFPLLLISEISSF